LNIEELKKVVESAKNNPDFDMNNWGECLVGSYLKDKTDIKLFGDWNNSVWSSQRYDAVADYFKIGIDDANYLFGMRQEYNDIYDEDPEFDTPKDLRMRVRNLAIDRLEEFIWEVENA
jgi:hypothetical protein